MFLTKIIIIKNLLSQAQLTAEAPYRGGNLEPALVRLEPPGWQIGMQMPHSCVPLGSLNPLGTNLFFCYVPAPPSKVAGGPSERQARRRFDTQAEWV